MFLTLPHKCNSRTAPKGIIQLQQFLMNTTSFMQQYVDHGTKQNSEVCVCVCVCVSVRACVCMRSRISSISVLVYVCVCALADQFIDLSTGDQFVRIVRSTNFPSSHLPLSFCML